MSATIHSHYLSPFKILLFSELIYKTETDSQTYRTNLWLPVGKGGWWG